MRRYVFTCVENAGRSQMAHAFMQKYAPDTESSSAGTRPAPHVNPVVVEAMREAGIDISGNLPAPLSGPVAPGTTLVSMGCMDKAACPALLHYNIISWDIPDPKGRPIEEVRVIRDYIEDKIRKLASSDT